MNIMLVTVMYSLKLMMTNNDYDFRFVDDMSLVTMMISVVMII